MDGVGAVLVGVKSRFFGESDKRTLGARIGLDTEISGVSDLFDGDLLRFIAGFLLGFFEGKVFFPNTIDGPG